MGCLSPLSHHSPWRAWRCSPRPSRLVSRPLLDTLPPQRGNSACPLQLYLTRDPSAHSSVLRRIRVTFLDTVVRVEHSLGDGEHGVAVEVHVQR